MLQHTQPINTPKAHYRRHRFPPEIISDSVWVYHRFALSFCDVEDLLAEGDIIVSYESIRRRCLKFALAISGASNAVKVNPTIIWYTDEVSVTIEGQIHHL